MIFFSKELSVYVFDLKKSINERDFEMIWVLFMNKFYCWIQNCKKIQISKVEI